MIRSNWKKFAKFLEGKTINIGGPLVANLNKMETKASWRFDPLVRKLKVDRDAQQDFVHAFSRYMERLFELNVENFGSEDRRCFDSNGFRRMYKHAFNLSQMIMANIACEHDRHFVMSLDNCGKIGLDIDLIDEKTNQRP